MQLRRRREWHSALGRGVLFSVVMLMIGSPSWAGEVLERIKNSNTLVVAVNEDYAPQSFQDVDGEWQGFDVDVAREIADRLGVGAEFKAPPWELVVSGMWRGRWEIAVNSMMPTVDRMQWLDFPTAYYFSPVRVAVRVDETRYEDVADLNAGAAPKKEGKSIVGVCRDCSYEYFITNSLSIPKKFSVKGDVALNVEARTFPNEWAAGEALGRSDSSEIDAVIAAEPTLQAMIEDAIPLRLLTGVVFYEPLAVATEKGDPELTEELKRIVDEMRADRTLSRLSEKWFGKDYSRPMAPQT
ncbi:MAG: transporter substrate-binding domain-containing protein [Alphaproteobacteria bacterium]|nr:transporter substrate-binding domain-containing protein [Alphaproteobacteria bacterium]